jgi:hypothetical protein
MTLARLGTRYRFDTPGNEEGVVLIWDGQVYGWKNVLRNAEHAQPGAIAVDPEGHVFIVEGGNNYDGAKAWVGMFPVDDN